MKILHLFNTAGVASTIAKYQTLLGHKATVLTRSAMAMFGAKEVYPFIISIPGGVKRYTLNCLKHIPQYDIIHSNAPRFTATYIIPLIRWKKYVFHYHGTWIREKWDVPPRPKIVQKADFNAVSTPELLEGSPPGVEWVPNPVDLDQWKRTAPYKPGTALFILRWGMQKPAMYQAIDECKEHGLKLTTLDRNTSSIPHREFPTFLQQFEYYIDTKIYETCEPEEVNNNLDKHYSEVKKNHSLSMTALQQLALGGKVLNDGDIIAGFPRVHDPYLVAMRWLKIYEKVLA